MRLDLRNFLKGYSSTLYVISTGEGYYDWGNGGIWVPGGEVRTDFSGAIVPFTIRELTEQIQYGEGGAYTKSDRKVYTHTPLELDDIIEFKDTQYKVAEKVDYAHLANGLCIYYVRQVE